MFCRIVTSFSYNVKAVAHELYFFGFVFRLCYPLFHQFDTGIIYLLLVYAMQLVPSPCILSLYRLYFLHHLHTIIQSNTSLGWKMTSSIDLFLSQVF